MSSSLRGEGLVWLIGAVVCQCAAPRVHYPCFISPLGRPSIFLYVFLSCLCHPLCQNNLFYQPLILHPVYVTEEVQFLSIILYTMLMLLSVLFFTIFYSLFSVAT